MQNSNRQFLSGVVEGFYGRPWNETERGRLSECLERWGLNTYLYAPKDDLKHRVLWRALYSDAELEKLRRLLGECGRRKLNFIWAIGPGLDLVYSRSEDLAALRRKILQVREAGCRHFALLFDDIPPVLPEAERNTFGSLAEAQAAVAHEVLRVVAGKPEPGRLLFCPTEYCGRMAQPSVAASPYLRELGERLDQTIDVLWTGPEIVSETISMESVREVASVLRRKPVLWDNLHANDYDARRIYLGPYDGRPPELRGEVAGILANPNCEWPANYVPLKTLASYMAAGPEWAARNAYRQALAEWLPSWRTQAGEPITLAELEWLGDCFYLPHRNGDGAREWLASAALLARQPPAPWSERVTEFRKRAEMTLRLFEKMTALEDRELLHAFYRQMWALKEEAHLWLRYLEWRAGTSPAGERFHSPELRPDTYRGGLVAELQRLLEIDAEGGITATAKCCRQGEAPIR